MRAERPYSMSHGGNVGAGRTAKTPEGQRRHTVLRYARPPPKRRLFLPFSSLCSFLTKRIKGKLGFLGGGRATLPAFGRRLRLDGVRGKPPTKIGIWGCLFARWGGKFFAAPPGFFRHSGECAQKVGSATQISNFFEIEFTRLSPLR